MRILSQRSRKLKGSVTENGILLRDMWLKLIQLQQGNKIWRLAPGHRLAGPDHLSVRTQGPQRQVGTSTAAVKKKKTLWSLYIGYICISVSKWRLWHLMIGPISLRSPLVSSPHPQTYISAAGKQQIRKGRPPLLLQKAGVFVSGALHCFHVDCDISALTILRTYLFKTR